MPNKVSLIWSRRLYTVLTCCFTRPILCLIDRADRRVRSAAEMAVDGEYDTELVIGLRQASNPVQNVRTFSYPRSMGRFAKRPTMALRTVVFPLPDAPILVT